MYHKCYVSETPPPPQQGQVFKKLMKRRQSLWNCITVAQRSAMIVEPSRRNKGFSTSILEKTFDKKNTMNNSMKTLLCLPSIHSKIQLLWFSHFLNKLFVKFLFFGLVFDPFCTENSNLRITYNPNPLGIFTRKYPESTKIHQFCHTQNAGVLNPSESASVDIGHILNPLKSTTNFLVDFGRFRIPCSHENLYSMLLHRIHQNLTYTVHVTIIHQPTWPCS